MEIQSQPNIAAVQQSVTNSLPKDRKMLGMVIALFVVAVIAGILTGKALATGGLNLGGSKSVAPGAVNSANEAGVSDTSTFKDTAQGVLKEGGANGEGDFHLERDGGPSQNVYLSSTVIDLQSFVGKKVQVWGQTLSAKKAGWLMDVGKIKVVQ